MNRFWGLLNHYLLISVTLAFTSGIFLYHLFPIPPQTALLPSTLLLCTALYTYRNNKKLVATIVLLLVVSSLGFFHAANSTSHHLKENTIHSHITQEEDVVLTGTLHKMPQFNGEKSTVIIKSHSLRLQQEDLFSSTHGLVRLRLKGEWPDYLLPGDEIVIRCQLSRPYRFGNPGGFDYPAFLAAKNIWIVGKIRSTAHIHRLIQKYSWFHSLRYLPERIRLSFRDVINNTLSSDKAGIYRALLIGDRSGIDKKTLETFKISGVMHILAISGLHLSLVASALFLICYWLARRSRYLMLHYSCKKLALLATILPLCGYALLAGAQTPVLRSLIMVLVFILAFCVQRQRSPFTTLSFAALIILILNPLGLLTISFQLSFAAVAALILILPRISTLIQQKEASGENRVRRLYSGSIRLVTAALLVSIAATLGTAPLLLHSFNLISTVGPVANLLLEPLLCLWSLPLGLLSMVFLNIAPQYCQWFLQAGGMGITAALSVTSFFAEYNFSALWLATPSIGLIVLYYLSLVLCFFPFSRKKTIPLFLLVCTLFFFPPRYFPGKFSTRSELVFLDVGQGSSTLVLFPDGKKVLIDGGGASSSKFNVGESIIAPYLWYRGITHLDAIVITHPDSDHCNGIPFLLKRFHPDTLWINGDTGHNQEYADLLDLARNLAIHIKQPDSNEVIMESQNAVLRNISNPFLNTSNKYNAAIPLSSNAKSLILRFAEEGQNLSCLFPGDISRKVEKALLQNNSLLQSSILLAPHHGSKTSNSPLFLDAVHPQKIVVSAGRFRPALFPSSQLRLHCGKNNIPLLNTAELGAVTVKITDVGVAIDTFKKLPDIPVQLSFFYDSD